MASKLTDLKFADLKQFIAVCGFLALDISFDKQQMFTQFVSMEKSILKALGNRLIQSDSLYTSHAKLSCFGLNSTELQTHHSLYLLYIALFSTEICLRFK